MDGLDFVVKIKREDGWMDGWMEAELMWWSLPLSGEV
jgi:hypothetical protein